MRDRRGDGDDPTTLDWLRAALLVVLAAIAVTATLIWFTFTFVAGPCCAASPS